MTTKLHYLVYNEKTNHIGIDCHIVREKIQDGLLQTAFLPPKDQIRDIFMKALEKEDFLQLRSKLNVLDIHTPTLGGVLEIRNKAMIQGRLLSRLIGD